MSEKRSSNLRSYLIALGAVAAATALSRILVELFGSRPNAFPLIFLIAIVASAWRGYGPGIFATLLSLYVAPYGYRPHEFGPVATEISRAAQAVIISLLASSLARSQKSTEDALRRGKDELEERVSQRTTELERANSGVLQAQRRLNDVLNSVSESFLALDKNWHLTFVNRRISDAVGKSAEEVVGAVIWDVFPEARNTEFYTQYKRVMDEQVPVHFEMFFEPGGRWLEVNAHPTPEGLSAYVVDITDRKMYEADLARFASIVESSGDAIISKNLDGIILTWNPAAERVYGFESQEVIGRPMESIMPPDKVPEERHILEQLRRGERIDHFETVRVRRDGTPIDVSLTISPVRNSAGEVIGASHIARDITADKSFQRQLNQVQKLESLGVLAGGVAHDFNNLLVGILGNASLALEDAPPQLRPPLEDVISAGEKAADLTRQLLAYAGKGKLHSRPLELSALVREIAALLRVSIARSVDLRLDLTDGLPPVVADSGQIQQVVMNLVINAAEAVGTDQPGSVSVRTVPVEADSDYLSTAFGGDDLKPGPYVMLEVHDTGCGMDAQTIAKIFDPFFTTKFLGRGLGLSAVVGIVRSHGGGLRVYSEPGIGTTFRVLFPAGSGKVEAPAPTPAHADLRGSGTVLVIDDDDMVRKVARATLERHGYEVVETANGELGLGALKSDSDRIRVVLLDLTMPVMGGEEALRHISVTHPHLPVILSSGFNESEAMQRFGGKGVAGFLQKPYTSIQLASVLHKVSVDGSRTESTLDLGRKASV